MSPAAAAPVVPELTSDYRPDLIAVVGLLVCIAVLLCIVWRWSGP